MEGRLESSCLDGVVVSLAFLRLVFFLPGLVEMVSSSSFSSSPSLLSYSGSTMSLKECVVSDGCTC